MNDYKLFAAIIIATDVEEYNVKRMYSWKKLIFEDDEQEYFETFFDDKYLIYSKQDEMGMTAAATLTMKLIEKFRPKYIIMPGIVGGTYEEESFNEMYGDIILADMVWNHSNGKIATNNEMDQIYGKLDFLPRPTTVKVDKDLLELIKKYINRKENQNCVHIGPIASGYAVIANKMVVDKKIKGQYSNTLGIDMESYGVVYATNYATLPRPKAIIAKGICDFADKNKKDLYQRFAAYTSCEFVKYLIENVLK